jgi:hypothetical protein
MCLVFRDDPVQSSPVQWKVSGDKSHRLLAESSFSAPHYGVFNLEVLAWRIVSTDCGAWDL